MRVYLLCTLLWVLVFLARGLVQRYLYDQDLTGWLAFARLAMGYPFTIGALAVSVFAVRRVRKTEQQDTTPEDLPDDLVAERLRLRPES
jgi:hypothetical protein